MTATSPKGFPQYDNSSAMDGPNQINAAELFVENLIGETVTTAASLPSSGSWANRVILAQDTGLQYIDRVGNGIWQSLPSGLINDAVGPSGQTDVSALTALASVTVNVVAGELYAVSASATGQKITNPGYAIFGLYAGASELKRLFGTSSDNIPTQMSAAGSGRYIYAATTTGSVTFSINANATSALRVAANNASISVEHIGRVFII